MPWHQCGFILKKIRSPNEALGNRRATLKNRANMVEQAAELHRGIRPSHQSDHRFGCQQGL